MLEQVLDFWFEEITPKDWWQKSDDFDRSIESRFAEMYAQAVQGELFFWRHTARGRLAEIIVLDQFSRNIYRDKPQAFAADSMALVLAQEAVSLGEDKNLNETERAFLYMPYMHSESAAIHVIAEQLFNQPGLENNYHFELRHKAIIDRFGRYPHRNAILGRDSTEEEIAFLETPGSSF